EGRERDAVPHEGLAVRADGGVRRGLEEQLDRVVAGRGHGEPAVLVAHRDVVLHGEAEHARVEVQGGGLVVDEHARDVDARHGVSYVTGQRAGISASGEVSMWWYL